MKTIFFVTGLALLSLSLAVIGNNNVLAQQTANTNNQTGTGGAPANATGTAVSTMDCDMIASRLGGKAIPNPTGQDVCDVSVLRESVNITEETAGVNVNKLLFANSLFEFMAMPNATDNTTAAFGMVEFALLETELPSVMRTLSNSSWNVVAVHNHMIMESPKMIFVHAMGTGDLETLIGDARSIFDQVEAQQARAAGNNNQTGTTFGPQGENDTTTSTTEKQGNSNPLQEFGEALFGK